MTRPLLHCLLLAMLAAAQPAAAAEPNPYGPPTPAGSSEALDRDAMLGVAGAERSILAWLEAHPDADPARRRALQHRLCEIFGVRGWQAPRAKACAAERALKPGQDGDDDASMSAALANELPIRAIGAAAVALTDNRLGSKSADVTVNGITLPWFMDIGAEISVVPESSAARLGVRYAGGKVSVGTSTADVAGRIGVIDQLRIGDAIVENVPVLVLPDERLTVSGLPGNEKVTIPGILGLQVFVAFGRMAWTDHGSRLALGEEAPRAAGQIAHIYWHDGGVGIPISTARGVAGAHFDSGANSTYLFADGRALLSNEQIAAADHRTVRTGGAGGTIERQLTELARLDLIIGATPTTLTRVVLADNPGKVARIGSDFIAQTRLLVLDFERMTMSAEAAAVLAAAGPTR